MSAFVKHSHLNEHSQLLRQNRYAATMVFNILDRLLRIDSVLDLGCGIGVWMQAALAKPGRVVQGIDVEAFDPEELAVPWGLIVNATLDQPIELHRRYDLALCLETAEHISREGSVDLVFNCTRHSDIVLFSAAIPGQGGLHHVNEQPPEYWQNLFGQAGYDVVDAVRPLIWRDREIPAWYRQNMLVFVNREADSILHRLRAEAGKTSIPLYRAHPDLFHWQAQELGRRDAQLNESEQERARLHRREQAVSLEANLRIQELQADLDAQREYIGSALSSAWRLIDSVKCEREAARVRLAAVEDALARAQRERSELQSSISWRVTAPLRALGARLLRMRGY
jgi:hypothetical protein